MTLIYQLVSNPVCPFRGPAREVEIRAPVLEHRETCETGLTSGPLWGALLELLVGHVGQLLDLGIVSIETRKKIIYT